MTRDEAEELAPPERVTLSYDKFHGWWQCGGESPKHDFILADVVERRERALRALLQRWLNWDPWDLHQNADQLCDATQNALAAEDV